MRLNPALSVGAKDLLLGFGITAFDEVDHCSSEPASACLAVVASGEQLEPNLTFERAHPVLRCIPSRGPGMTRVDHHDESRKSFDIEMLEQRCQRNGLAQIWRISRVGRE
jgi:hypothetical protein